MKETVTTIKICSEVWELEDAVSSVTDDCPLSHPVKVEYVLDDHGNGSIRITAEQQNESNQE